MYTINVNHLSLGDKLAEDVYDTSNLLFKKGTVLTFHDIFTLLSSEVQQVKISRIPARLTNLRDELLFHQQYFQKTDKLQSIKNLYPKQVPLERYIKLIDSEDNYHFLTNLFISIITNSVADNILSALKIWDSYSYCHSLDVFIIGSLWLKHMEKENIKETSTGFLLHDIGKTKISREILQKKGKLTKKEFEIVKSHVYFGEHLLKKLGFSQLICDLAMFHHKVLDGSGYPDPYPNDAEVPEEIKQLMIVDIFSALTLDRPYRNAYSANEAIQIMNSEKHKFDSNLLKNFFEFIGKLIVPIQSSK